MLKLCKRPNFGFESENISYHHSYKSRRDLNLKRAVSYIPILGTVFGILELRQIYRDASGKKSTTTIQGKTYTHGPEAYNANQRKCRAVIETLSLGIIFLPVDIAATVRRKYKQVKLTSAEKQKLKEARKEPDPEPTPAKLKELEAIEKKLEKVKSDLKEVKPDLEEVKLDLTGMDPYGPKFYFVWNTVDQDFASYFDSFFESVAKKTGRSNDEVKQLIQDLIKSSRQQLILEPLVIEVKKIREEEENNHLYFFATYTHPSYAK